MVGARGFEPPTPGLPDAGEPLISLGNFGKHRIQPSLIPQDFSQRSETVGPFFPTAYVDDLGDCGTTDARP